MMMKNITTLAFILMMVLSSVAVSAGLTTTYNPFTGKLDYIQEVTGSSTNTTLTGDVTIQLVNDSYNFKVLEGATEIADFNGVDNYVQIESLLPQSSGSDTLGTGSFVWANVYVNGILSQANTNLTVTPSESMTISSPVYTESLKGLGGPATIGDGSSSQGLTSDESLFVTEKLEIGDTSYFVGNATSHNNFYAKQDAIVGDPINQDLFSIQANGTAVLIKSLNSALGVHIETYSPDGTKYTCSVANGGAWSCS